MPSTRVDAAAMSPHPIFPAVHGTTSPPDLRAVAAAFAADPLMHYFFANRATSVAESAREFFTLLMRARLALGMPVLLMGAGADITGTAMGYDTTRPEWPDAIAADWDAFEAGTPGLGDRFAAYEAIADTGMPAEPHYYLGVLGVAPALQGQGAGGALVDAFCARSAADARSAGVYLETGNPANVAFYRRHGFEVTHEAPLGPVRLWCLYHRHAIIAGA